MADSDIHTYTDDDLTDVDNNHAGTAHLEHDVIFNGARYEHLGTYIDVSDSLDLPDVRAGLWQSYRIDGIERRLTVVHRRVPVH